MHNNKIAVYSRLSQFFIFLFLLSFSLTASTKTFTVTTRGSGYNKQQAIHSALRAGVEKGLGIFIESQTKIENYQMISDKILSRTKGYVSQYELVPGSQQNEFGLVFLKVKATVKTAALRDDLEAMKLIYSLKNLPRIMVVVQEHSPGLTLRQRTTATIIESNLLAKGFRLVDKEQMNTIQERDRARFSDNTFAAKMGFRLGADLIITGEAEAGTPFEETVYSVKQWRAPCQMNLRLIRADNAQLISAAALSNDWASRSQMQAMNSSLKKTAKKASAQIINDLLAFWKDEVYNTSVIEVCVLGMQNIELSSLINKILKINTARSAALRYLEGENAVIDVETGGSVQNLREAFTRMKGITVRAMTANRIDISKSTQQKALPEIAFEIAEPDVAIVRAGFEPIYPCIYSWYAQNSAGTVHLKNNSSSAISNASIAVSVPKYTSLPTNTAVSSIPAQRNSPFNFKLTLDTRSVSQLSQRVQAQAGITMRYKFGSKTKERRLSVPITIESINAIRWTDPLMAASFITPNNKVIKALARQTLRAVSYTRDEQVISELAYAAAQFYALKSLDIAYVKDPHGAVGHDVTDNINYPTQTLEMKSGDCDDTSILFASLLESIGIETALIVYPDHVLVMLNTGIYEKNGMRISYNKNDYILHNHKLWIPVETTQLKTHSFIQAWHSATKEFSLAVSEGQNVEFVDVHTAWKKYPSFDPFQQKQLTVQPNLKQVTTAFTRDISSLKQDLEKGFITAEKTLAAKVKTDPSALGLNKLGILHARKGNLVKAESLFKKAGKKKASFAPAQNNLANIYCLRGDDAQSVDAYDKAISQDPQTGQYYINKGLCLLTQNKTDACLNAIKTGIAKLKTPEATQEILGMDLLQSATQGKGEKKKEPKKKPEVSRARIKNLMKNVLEKVPDKKIKDYSKNILPVGGLRGADPEQIEKIADLLWWAE